MAARAVKLAIQTALLVQALHGSSSTTQTSVSARGTAVSGNFESIQPPRPREAPGRVHSTDDNDDSVVESRGIFDGFSPNPADYKESDFKTTTPIPGTEPRPPTAEILAGLGSGLSALIPDNMKKAVMEDASLSASGSDEEEPAPKKAKKNKKAVSSANSGSSEALDEEESEAGSNEEEPTPKKTKKNKKAVLAADTGDSEALDEESEAGSNEEEPTPKKAKKAKKAVSAADLGSSGGSDEEMEGFADFFEDYGDDEGSTDESGSEGLDSLMLGAGSGADILSMFGGKGVEKDLDEDAFMSAVGGKLGGLAGLGGLGGGGMSMFEEDPTKPQHKKIDDGDIILGEVYGSKEHGRAFSDINNIKFGQMILNITLRGNKRLDKIELAVMTRDVVGNLVHGGDGGGAAHLAPELGDIITEVEVHWGKKDGKTRIFYMMMVTSGGKTISAGTKTPDHATLKAPPDFQFAGFHGRASGDGIFGVGAIYTRTGAQDLAVTDIMEVPDKGTSDIYNYDLTIRNWVGPAQAAADSACYQVRQGMSSMNTCPTGYKKDKKECVAQCPLGYPVECWRECIPQNADCMQEILSKAVSVAAAALSLASLGTFGTLFTTYKTMSFVIRCAVGIMNSVRNLMFYLRFRVTTVPRTEIEILMDKAFMLQIVIMDLPMAIAMCLGAPIPPSLQFSVMILTVVSVIVMMVVMIGEALFASKNNILLMLRESGAMNKSLKANTLELKDFINPDNATCGQEMRILTNRVISKVHEVRNKTKGAAPNDVRVVVSKSPIILRDVPVITNHCMGEIWENKTALSSYKTRHLIRKTLGVIINQLITDGTTDMGEKVAKQEKTLEYANVGLFVLSMFDPTGIAWMLQDFVQPVCGPTEYVGEIDDGPLSEALGLNTVGEAFTGSYGVWKKKGNGSVTILFESTDKYNVDVVVRVAGTKVDQVAVPAHGKATWTAHVKQLQDKTIYLDRWRPGWFGLPGKGGGSLLLWVPRSSEGGFLVMHARLNAS
ncbi:unnamed protein product [Hyaloperonospora brassicae]|uniref:Jacalin-type lectin domain-containing protein n=1 Tax=Hyaloperonospora brassicae TaxID=162125 RepID=A0AAV0SX89_HYABA|nr:unnamed protein product [Hyaloperonospora brassicae]